MRFGRFVLTSALVAAVFGPVSGTPTAAAPTLPAGFREEIVLVGLGKPTNVEFAPDGRVFVAEKAGRVKVFDGLSDPTPTVFADLTANVQNLDDRGLLGLALHPNFPADPWVYVLYTYDAPPGQSVPYWNDNCDAVGGVNGGRCVVTARLSRLQAAGDVMTGSEQVLIHDWCQQYSSHSIGDLRFGPDGALYVSAGDGASYNSTDYGQLGSPNHNPCGDPPGGAMSLPGAEGGALRSQDLRTSGDPTGLDGTVLRLDPATGAGLPDNPLAASADPNNRRIVGIGLRNPFRFAIRPGTTEMWLGDVGQGSWESVERLVAPTAGVMNFGWPCYQGPNRNGGYDSANLTLCESLYASGAAVPPYFAYRHDSPVASGESCANGGSSVSGLAFYPAAGGSYPASYAGALFFADYSRDCMWVMRAGASGLPDPADVVTFAGGAANPVDLQVGPDNLVYYVDHSGSVRRFRYFAGNQPPIAAAAATPTSGVAPLTVSFDASGSTDPDDVVLTYGWDFTDDGTVDSTAVTPAHTYTAVGAYTARLTVTDPDGATGTATVTVHVGVEPPVPVIDAPTTATSWAVGETAAFAGHATDPQQGSLPPSALAWQLVLHHCATVDNCHAHNLQEWSGVASGSFVTPDHAYPSYLELVLTATDTEGLTASAPVRLDPRTVTLTFATEPPGLQLAVGQTIGTAPFSRTMIQGSSTSVSAVTPQSAGGTTYAYESWSDGGGQTHVVTAPATATTLTARFAEAPGCLDAYGYTCTVGPRAFTPANDAVLPLTGDEAVAVVGLPFGFPFYGRAYTTAWVDTNGKLSFVDPGGPEGTNTALPSSAPPNAAVYAFWDDLVVKAGPSTVRTALTGTAPNRQFTVEWRSVNVYRTSLYLSVEIVLHESGEITLGYDGISSTNTREQGSSATVGIENADGTVALTHSVNQPVLRSGTAVVFTPPGGTVPTTGTITGTATAAANGAPVAGATVTLTPGGRVTATDAAGHYRFDEVPAGPYTVAAAAGDLSGSASVVVTASGSHVVDLLLSAPTGDYAVSTTALPFAPADQAVLALAGDNAIEVVPLPFAFPFYGQTYAAAWVHTDGTLSFVDPTRSWGTNTALPATALPNAAVYGFWDDLVVKAGTTTVRTAVVGAGGNRQFIVEWRSVNVCQTSLYLSVEIVLHETGEITLNYDGISSTNSREQGDSATVGIENAAGTVAVVHSTNAPVLRSGLAVQFRPR